MTDEDLQAQLRAAEGSKDAGAWLRAAQALARAGRLSESGGAAGGQRRPGDPGRADRTEQPEELPAVQAWL